MKMFDSGLEVLIIKYTLGTCFVVVFIVFGMKILILLSTVAKMKLAGYIAVLKGSKLGWLADVLTKIAERGAVK